MGLFNRLFGNKAPVASPSGHVPETPPSFPYELISTPGAKAVAKALSLREEWRGSFTPVILGTAKDFGLLTDLWDEIKQSPEDILKAADGIVLAEWFKARLEDAAPLEDVTDPSAWDPGSSAEDDFAVARDSLSRKFHPNVWIAKVPTARPCEVPAWLKIGGWNACPPAEEHVAVWRHWQKTYGAEILCASGDVIEATVTRPPQDREACYALAREQFAYCDDIVTQGVGTTDALASGLHGARHWFFWWD